MKTKKTAIVTGSSSGIGLGVAKALVERGDNVVLHGRDEAKLKRVAAELGTPHRVAWVAGDLSDLSLGEALVREALDRFGGVDVLVNNAGLFEPKPFLEVTSDDLDLYLSSNLRGTYFVTQAVVRQMAKAGGGSVINIGTVMVHHAIGGFPCSAPVVTKGAIHTLTTLLAAELAPMNIRVNLVAPGVIRTPLQGEGVDDYAGLALLNRVGEADEIAEAVIHLADAAFTTGVVLPVDGGHAAGHALG